MASKARRVLSSKARTSPVAAAGRTKDPVESRGAPLTRGPTGEGPRSTLAAAGLKGPGERARMGLRERSRPFLGVVTVEGGLCPPL